MCNVIELKSLNRCVILNLEERRRELEQKKTVVDQLQLNLENLQYKEAFLNREISACQDLATPCLNEIENFSPSITRVFSRRNFTES